MNKFFQGYQSDFPNLFSPMKIKGVTIKNRVFLAPMTLELSMDKHEFLTERGMHIFGDMAKGGTGVITLGEAKLDDTNSKAHEMHFECRDSRVMHPYHFFTEYLHAFGALASIELNHDGQFSLPQFNRKGLPPMGASEMTMPNGVFVREMNEDDMAQVAESYAQSALLARRGGFDMILLHFAHGWLMGGFLSPLINHRKDKYNGSHENRMRFPLQVIRRIREVAGEDLVIEVRLSGDEYTPGGIQIQDAVEYAKILEAQGKIDLLHLSCATRFNADTRPLMIPSQFVEPGHNVKFAAAVKKAGVKIPIGTVGAISDPYQAEAILASGQADYIVMARQLMADPDWANKAKHGRAEDIRPCRRCLHCMDTHRVNKGNVVLDDWRSTHLTSCDINPTYGHRALIGEIPFPVRKKRIAVIGGGPAGMEAALEASRRGHSVDLYERQEKLGGLINIYSEPVWFKQGDFQYRNYLVRQIEKSGVRVHLKTGATPEFIYSTRPDAVIVAIGGKIYQPKIEGMNRIRNLNVLGIYHNEEKLGQNIVIIGGGLSGCEAALHLADKGKEIILITPESDLMPVVPLSLRSHTLQHLEKNAHITYYTGCEVKALQSGGVTVGIDDHTERILAADTVVFATGMRNQEKEAEAYLGTAIDVIPVGDCKRIGTIGTAIHDGYDAAASLLYG